MLQRRNFVYGLAGAAIGAGVAPCARAQRPIHPIARPPGLGSGLVPGRFDGNGGIATGASPGIYVVVSVDTQADTLRLSDGEGRTALVYANGRAFDLSPLRPGDEVQVDFLIPEPGSTRLEAGGLWKVTR